MTSERDETIPALLPCPFCGAKGLLNSNPERGYVVRCEEGSQYCPAACMHAYMHKKEWAVAQWNRRTRPSSEALQRAREDAEALIDLASWVEDECGADLPHDHISAAVERARAAKRQEAGDER